MAAFNKLNDFTEQLARGGHDFDAHTFKVALTNTAPVAGDATWNVGAHPAPAAANGYAAGGAATTISIAEAAGVTTVQGTSVLFTATAGGIGPFRYGVLYNDTAGDAGVGWFDYGSSITLADGEDFEVRFNNATPGTIFTLT